eukprot:jgi/Botrbrau1/12420/Bobra.0229s0016.1
MDLYCNVQLTSGCNPQASMFDQLHVSHCDDANAGHPLQRVHQRMKGTSVNTYSLVKPCILAKGVLVDQLQQCT